MITQLVPMPSSQFTASAENAFALPARYVRFGSFHLDLRKEELLKDGTRVKLQGKVYQALLALLEKPGEVVTREALRMRLWPSDTHVNYDANVNTTVNKLRQALGDSSDKPLYIETIPRKGYCFLLQPEISDESPHSHFARGEASADSAQDSSRSSRGLAFSRSDVWIVLGVIGLILAGMLLGAGITRLWISHAAPMAPYPSAIIFSLASAAAFF